MDGARPGMIGQEGDDHLFRDVRDQQVYRGAPRLSGRESQEQLERVPVLTRQ
jgi:hypothetical protein